MKQKHATIKLMRKILLISFLVLLAFYLMPSPTEAALVTCGNTTDDPCQFCDFFVMINDIVKFFVLPPTGVVFIVAALMLVVGGVLFFFGGVNPAMLTKAKGIMTSVVIGLVIIFCAWVIVNTIITQIGIVQSPSVLQWYDIGCQ